MSVCVSGHRSIGAFTSPDGTSFAVRSKQFHVTKQRRPTDGRSLTPFANQSG